MLNTQSSEQASFASIEEPEQVREFGLGDLVAFFRRRRRAIAISITVFLALGILVRAIIPAQYAATASLVIDTRKIQIFGTGDVSAEASITNSSIETEIQILQSSRIAEAVVDKLNLTKNSAFMTPPPTRAGAAIGDFVGLVLSVFPQRNAVAPIEHPSPEELASAENLAAVNLLKGNVAIARDGISYAISVTAFSGDPVLAARIANAVTDAYLADQIERQVGAAKRLSEWLAARIEELRSRAYEDLSITAQEKAASRDTYESFVQRYSQAVQQQSLPESQALVITQATPPMRRISPRTSIILVASIVLGGILGVAIGIVRELLDRAIRTSEILERAAQTPTLGVLPKFKLRRWRRKRSRANYTAPTDETPRVFSPPPHFTVAQEAPFSLFAETLRRIKVAGDFGRNGRVGVLGVVSSAANEGKTTVAANLATLLGAGTRNILLVDADFRNPSLTWSLTPDECPGLIQVLSNHSKLDDVLWVAENSTLRFLPTGGDPAGSGSSELLSSNRMKELMNELRERFDLVIVDLPPMASVVDVRAADHVFDGFVFVVEWGVTTRETIAQALRNSGIQQKLIGAVFNKVRLSRLRRYDPSNAATLLNAYFTAYRDVK